MEEQNLKQFNARLEQLLVALRAGAATADEAARVSTLCITCAGAREAAS